MKILVISPKNKTVFNFRGDLIRDMIDKGNEVFVIGPNRDYLDDILALGVKRFVEVPLEKDNTSVTGDLKYLIHLTKVIRELRPDMVFSYTIKPVIYGSIAARMCGVKHIFPMVTGLGRVYASQSMKAKLTKKLTKMLYTIAFKGCEKVIFQNPDDIDEFVSQKYLPKEKCALVNGSGVNMSRFARTAIPDEPVFLMVSRIIREKGILEFAKAARIVKARFPNARCCVLGGYDKSIGALKEEDLREYVEDGSIELLGEVKEPVSVYSECSVFVLPSYYREGLPRTILEAMSCGRPVITTDWVGCREPIEDGVNGFLVPIKDSCALAEKMKLLSLDPKQRESMGQAAYDICREKYSAEIVNRQIREQMGY